MAPRWQGGDPAALKNGDRLQIDTFGNHGASFRRDGRAGRYLARRFARRFNRCPQSGGARAVVASVGRPSPLPASDVGAARAQNAEPLDLGLLLPSARAGASGGAGFAEGADSRCSRCRSGGRESRSARAIRRAAFLFRRGCAREVRLRRTGTTCRRSRTASARRKSNCREQAARCCRTTGTQPEAGSNRVPGRNGSRSMSSPSPGRRRM